MKLLYSTFRRVKNLISKDAFSCVSFSRLLHYRLNLYLWEKYSPSLRGIEFLSVPGVDYLLPSYLMDLPSEERICISGGIQFHTELEDDLLSRGFFVHGYEIDPISWKWFENAKNGVERFVLHKEGLYDQSVTIPFYGDHARNTSPSVLSEFHDDFNIDLIGSCSLVSLADALRSNCVSRIALVKLDIEGVAPKVVLQALRDQLLISCFVFESERPAGSSSYGFSYFQELLQLIALLEENGYSIVCYPRLDEYNSFSTLLTAYRLP